MFVVKLGGTEISMIGWMYGFNVQEKNKECQVHRSFAIGTSRFDN